MSRDELIRQVVFYSRSFKREPSSMANPRDNLEGLLRNQANFTQSEIDDVIMFLRLLDYEQIDSETVERWIYER